MLANAIATLTQFAAHRIQNRRRPKGTLNTHLTTEASIAVVARTAMTNVAAQVPGLNVPTLKTLYSTRPGKNSHANPRAGIRTIPAPVETAFITTSTTAAFFQDKPKPPKHRAAHSTMSPAVIGMTLRMRCSNTRAGHTTSAYSGTVRNMQRNVIKCFPSHDLPEFYPFTKVGRG